MVKTLHSAGIEVILDVVYNHTGEGNQLGPTLSLRGIDNAAYYRLNAENRRYYVDFTGCGNTLNLRAPARAAAGDGFAALLGRRDARRRLPLRPRLGARARGRQGRRTSAPSSTRSRQDPVLTSVKLIAEPWDLGHGGYQVGNFPPGWAEWNDQYRDTHARLLEGRRRRDRRLRAAPHRLAATSTAASGAARTPASTSSPRTTASRCTTWSPTTRSTTRPTARTTATATTTTCRGTAASRGRPTTPRSTRCASARSATSSPRCCCRRACRCCWPATSSATRSSGNNNAYCQDNEIGLARLDADAASARRCSTSAQR